MSSSTPVSRSIGTAWTIIITGIGVAASIVSLVATDDDISPSAIKILVIVGGVISLVANGISPAVGLYTPYAPLS